MTVAETGLAGGLDLVLLTSHVYSPVSLYSSLFITNVVLSSLALPERENSMDTRPANCGGDVLSIRTPSNIQLVSNAVVFCSTRHASCTDCKLGRSFTDLSTTTSTAVIVVAAVTTGYQCTWRILYVLLKMHTHTHRMYSYVAT